MTHQPQTDKRYLVQLYGMGAATPEVYELRNLTVAREMFQGSCDGICYRRAFLVELLPHARFQLLDCWGFADGPRRQVGRA